MRERVKEIMSIWRDPYKSHNCDEVREKFMNVINEYLTDNRIEKAKRLIETGNSDHGYLKYSTKNYNINKIKFFTEIPDGIEILIDYVDVTAIRTMNIPSEIIYHSIWLKLPELFENEE